MTEEEQAATAGRFVMSPKPVPDPAGSGDEGRESAAPQGEVYVRAEAFDETEPEEESEEESEDDGEEQAEEGYEEAVEPDDLTVAELKEELDSLGVEYPASARKAELIELLRQAEG
jgi:hypothetical protein